jgi:ADP-heptose:LPS heptosyltransferase
MIYALLTLFVSPLLRWLAGPGNPSAPRRVLVIQMAKIGDLLCSTPVFRELKRCYPHAEVHVLANPVNLPMLELDPNVDRVLPASATEFKGFAGKLGLVRRLRAERYDAVVCLNAGVAYAVCSLWALIPVRLAVLPNFCGRAYRLASRLWSAVEPHRGDRLIQDTYLGVLSRLGVSGGSHAKVLHAAPGAAERVRTLLGDAPPPLVGIGVSSANKLKELGTEKLAAVAAGLMARDPALRIVLVGSAADRPQAVAIVAEVPEPERMIDTTGMLGLAELPALLARLSAYVGVDSGVTYMADAVGVPLVSVAGPCNMAETRPLGNHAFIIQRQLPCAPCAHIFAAPYHCRTGTHACTRTVGAEEIVAAAGRLLDRAAIRKPG